MANNPLTPEEYRRKEKSIIRNGVIRAVGLVVLYPASFLLAAPQPERTSLVNLAETYGRATSRLDGAVDDLTSIVNFSAKEGQLGNVIHSLDETNKQLHKITAYEREHPDVAAYRQEMETHYNFMFYGMVAFILAEVINASYTISRIKKVREQEIANLLDDAFTNYCKI